ncbi:MAG: glycosyl hydrolase [Acidobacteriota bacterium]
MRDSRQLRTAALLAATAFLILALPSTAQRSGEGSSDGVSAGTFSALSLRGIGPALRSGRISDLAIHPQDKNTWYVAAGSGGVWKTTNFGTTWKAIFASQPSYSIGDVTLDPTNPEIVWVGTGENSSGRHVGFGDGVYKSSDGGKTWKNMGLETSEHIGKIVVHPEDGNVVYVAAEGPLWSSGGERGLYKTTDGGETWERILFVNDDTGVTDIHYDPRDPDVLYAATYDRRRKVWALINGPGSGIHKSTDGGATWTELTNGLPKGDMGKIGLAISPMRPDVVYATIEASQEPGNNEAGFYRSTDRGASWVKRNDYHSGGTGPHYYQEIFASPHVFDRVYQMAPRINITEDGGLTFRELGEIDKHGDNHAMAFLPDEPEFILNGSDGGVYYTHDHAKTWKYVQNLPLTQFYKLSIDYDLPFYNVAGGTQDNGTQVGPSRTLNSHGIRTADWTVAYGADGYMTMVDPTDANVLYVTWQNGHPLRYDKRTGETIDIQPQPGPDDEPERWNWDAPMIISPHDHKRIYMGSQRLWRTDDRGDSWTVLPGEFTRGVTRYERDMDGRTAGDEAVWGNTAMSWHANMTAIAESPLVEGLLYVGTDDGLIQISEDSGQTWRRADLSGFPELLFVNELTASPTDADTVFASVDNHKMGDYAPYPLRSDDRGRTWRSIAGDLPDRHLIWSLQQDHVDPNLLFAGTEFGIYFTIDGGEQWLKMAGSPTIAYRDLDIQRRENDLVGASFGRGFYVLDDYSPLRNLSSERLEEEAILFAPRRTWWYVPSTPHGRRPKGTSGSDYFVAPNPPFGATLTYYLRETPKTARQERRKAESERRASGETVPFPDWDVLRAEDQQAEVGMKTQVMLTVRNAAGDVVRRIEGPARSGMQRVTWDLRLPMAMPTRLGGGGRGFGRGPQGPLAPPGSYSVELALLEGGELRALGGPQNFDLVDLENRTLEGLPASEIQTFQKQTNDLLRRATAVAAELERADERAQHAALAIPVTPGLDASLLADVVALRERLYGLDRRLNGDETLGRFQEPSLPGVLQRIFTVVRGHWNTRLGPTQTHRQSLAIAASQLDAIRDELAAVDTDLGSLEQQLDAAGAPWSPGRAIPE